MRVAGDKSKFQRQRSKLEKFKFSAVQIHDLEDIFGRPVSYVPDDRFDDTTAMCRIMEQEDTVTPGVTLSSEQSELMFLQLNFSRYRMCQIRRELMKSSKWNKKKVSDLLSWYRRQLRIRSQIISGNMGLVLAMAKYANYTGVEFTDLISEGSMALLRASEKFDCSRGYKFSTYACRAILKGFSRSAKRNYRYRSLFPTQLDPAMEKDDHIDQMRHRAHQERVDDVRDIFCNNLADLSQTEYQVVQMRFPLNESNPAPMTLKQVGEKLGLSKERIRQIQNKALAKLRVAAEERMTYC